MDVEYIVTSNDIKENIIVKEKKVSYEYSEALNNYGALIAETDTLDRTVRYFYDSRDGKLLATVNEESGNGTVYEYDVFDRLTKTLPAAYSSYTQTYTPEENTEQVEYEYDSSNRLSEIRTESTVYTFTYDGFGNSTEIKAGNNTLASYVYNENNGKLERVIYGNGYTEYYYYNALENLEKICYTDSSVTEQTELYTYEYTSSGQISTVTDHRNGKTTAYYYNSEYNLRLNMCQRG